MILVPDRKIIVPAPISTPAHLEGWYKFEAVKADGSNRRRILADWFPNLITDVGLNGLGTNSIAGLLTWCKVGTGTATPQFTDTALAAWVASHNVTQSTTMANSGAVPYYSSYTNVCRFNAGVAAGNLSEVGMGTTSSNVTGILYSRALILDGAGNPTTITVLADEYLDVTYQHRVYYPAEADLAYSTDMSGVTYSGVMRRADVTTTGNWQYPAPTMSGGQNVHSVYTGAIGPVTGSPSGASGSKVVSSIAAYANNSLQRDFTIDWGLNDGNINIASMYIHTTFGNFQFSVSPVIPKTAAKVMSMTFRCGPWGRYTP